MDGKLFFAGIALAATILLFGCLGQQVQAPIPVPTAIPTLQATAVATIDVSGVTSDIDAATKALDDAINSTSDAAIGDIDSSDLDFT